MTTLLTVFACGMFFYALVAFHQQDIIYLKPVNYFFSLSNILIYHYLYLSPKCLISSQGQNYWIKRSKHTDKVLGTQARFSRKYIRVPISVQTQPRLDIFLFLILPFGLVKKTYLVLICISFISSNIKHVFNFTIYFSSISKH